MWALRAAPIGRRAWGGSTALVTFTGTALSLRAKKGPAFGQMSVSLDGGAAIPVDLYASTVADQQVVWSSPAGLADTEHTVLVTCSYSKSKKSTGYEVNLDALDVVGTLPNPVVHVGLVDEGMRLDPAWSLP